MSPTEIAQFVRDFNLNDESDAKHILALAKDHGFTPGRLDAVNGEDTWCLEKFKGIFRGAVAIEGDELCGFVSLADDFATFVGCAHLDTIAVADTMIDALQLTDMALNDVIEFCQTYEAVKATKKVPKRAEPQEPAPLDEWPVWKLDAETRKAELTRIEAVIDDLEEKVREADTRRSELFHWIAMDNKLEEAELTIETLKTQKLTIETMRTQTDETVDD